MPEQAYETGYLLLEGLIRLIGALWTLGALVLFLVVWRESRLDNLVRQLERGVEAISEEPATARSAEELWEDRDDRARRFWLIAQGMLLLATALSMALLHRTATVLVALLVAAQGFYFFWRERQARSAPSEGLAAAARPAQSTVNAGWFSLGAGVLVWTAFAAGRLN